LESIQTLIFIGAFRSTGKSKSQLIIEARMLLVNHKSTSNNPLLLVEPSQEFKFPLMERSYLEDAFDEMELLGFPVSCSPLIC
jgi:hypothetical protein